MNAIFKSSIKIIALTFLVVFALNLNHIRNTNSTLADKEKSRDNSFAAGTWGNNDKNDKPENILAPSLDVVAGETAPEMVGAPDINDGVTSPETSAPLLEETTSPENTPTEEPHVSPQDPIPSDTNPPDNTE
jgi:hypothetical protein